MVSRSWRCWQPGGSRRAASSSWTSRRPGLSFVSQLTLIGQLAELVAEGRTQLVIATHSPVLARLPGATLLQLDERGVGRVDWKDLAVVDHYRAFLANPDVYLHHLLPPKALF